MLGLKAVMFGSPTTSAGREFRDQNHVSMSGLVDTSAFSGVIPRWGCVRCQASKERPRAAQIWPVDFSETGASRRIAPLSDDWEGHHSTNSLLHLPRDLPRHAAVARLQPRP